MSVILRSLSQQLKSCHTNSITNEVRWLQRRFIKDKCITYDYLIHPRPLKADRQSYRRVVHFEDKYTIKPLNTTNLGGRDPITGRVIVKTLGGGIKYKFHWIHWLRSGPTGDEPPIEEEVIDIIFDGNRAARVALVARGDEMKYYIAPHELQPGDIIKTSCYIPKIPHQSPSIGDAYPLGALQDGTMVHCVESHPGSGAKLLRTAGTFGTITKHNAGKVHLKMPSKHEIICDEKCMATIGRVSNIEHSSIPIGSPNRLRELGYRPRSGLWQRKDGRFGRKIRAPKTFVFEKKAVNTVTLMLDSVRVPKFNGI